MKKTIKLFLIIFFTIVCSSCGMEKDIIRIGKGDLVIEYTSSPIFTNREDKIEYYIRLYDDKTISSGKDKYEVSNEDYQKIINYAFSPSFVNMKQDLTDDRVMDGSSRYITLHFEDGTSKKYGGLNPSDSKFLKLYKMLNEAVEKGEEE